MKLLYLMASSGWGGMEKHTMEVAEAMAARGHETYLLSSQEYQAHCPSTVNLLRFDWGNFRRNPLLWWRLRMTLEKLQPDIIHAQAVKASYVLSRSGWPVGSIAIGTVHNLKSDYGAYRALNTVIAVSNQIAAQIDHPNLRVVHNGVRRVIPDPDVLHKLRHWRAQNKGMLVLAIGRLVPAKAFDRLLHAWPADSGNTLVILGEGKCRDQLQAIIASRNLKQVYLMGESRHVTEWIASADLLVISSQKEGGPYVLPEALMQGIPVISTNVGMVPDFLPASCIADNNKNRDFEHLLAKALTDPAAVLHACRPAIELARQQLTNRAMMDSLEKIYLGAVQSQQARATR